MSMVGLVLLIACANVANLLLVGPGLFVRSLHNLRATETGVALEVFNLFNSSAITSRTIRSGSSYFRPQGLVGPRTARLAFTYRF